MQLIRYFFHSCLLFILIFLYAPFFYYGLNSLLPFLNVSEAIKKKFFAGRKTDLKIEAQEIRQFEENASLVAQNVAEQMEKRIPFRRILKSSLDQVEKNRNVKGVKIEVSGRLGGAEMSRREWLSRGTVPLHTLRADIDFAKATAYTTYGTIGVKVWIYKGEVFNNDNNQE